MFTVCSLNVAALGWAAFEGRTGVAEALHTVGGGDLLAEDQRNQLVPRQLAEHNGHFDTAQRLSELARHHWLHINKPKTV
jgi:hypothetical protein